jgi:hypothetical protein
MGNLYVVDSNRASVRKLALATGAVTTFVAPIAEPMGSPTYPYPFYSPVDVTLDGAGGLYIAYHIHEASDHQEASIRRVDITSGAVTTVAGPAEIVGPYDPIPGVGSDGAGGSARFRSLRGITSAGDGNLYVADTTAVRKVVVATGEVTTLAGSLDTSGRADGLALAARFNGANSITSDHAGNLYVSDEGNHAVRKIVIATGAVTTVVGSPVISRASA